MIRHNNKLYELQVNDLVEAYVEHPIPEGSPTFMWKGSKIPMELWDKIVSFFLKQYEMFKGESQVRLYYKKDTREWGAWAHAQERSSGMTTKELPDHANRLEDNLLFLTEDGWLEAGTVHHHCGSSAFQSGTDRDNELAQHGLHITIGRLTDEALDLHMRSTYGGVQYEADIENWFELPDDLAAMHSSLHATLLEWRMLVQPKLEPSAFPQRWIDNLIEREPFQSGFRVAHGHPMNAHNKQWTGQGRSKTRTELMCDLSLLEGITPICEAFVDNNVTLEEFVKFIADSSWAPHIVCGSEVELEITSIAYGTKEREMEAKLKLLNPSPVDDDLQLTLDELDQQSALPDIDVV